MPREPTETPAFAEQAELGLLLLLGSITLMKSSNTSGVGMRLFGLFIRLLSFVIGLAAAIFGAYLFLSGVVIIADQKLLPGLLDMLIGFVFISFGWRFTSSRVSSHAA